MTRILILGVLLIGSAICVPQEFASNPYLNGFSNDVNAFIADQQRQQQVDVDSNIFLQHAIAGRAIDSFNAPLYLPPKETIVCNGPQQCVRKDLCINGFFATKSGGAKKECSPDSEVCCTYRPPPPTPPPSIPCTGNNFACVSPAQCSNGVVKSSGFLNKQADKCFAPEVCCRVPEVPSTDLTSKGYVVRVPEVPFPKTVPAYLPPDRNPQPSSIKNNYLPPLKGFGDLSPFIPNPVVNTLTENLPPVKCAAALNCTEPQFCNSTGFITKTPVVLTKDQELFRVPLTECRDVSKGITGKCCRDPDYVDPWPTSLTDTGRYDVSFFGEKPVQPVTQRPPIFTENKSPSKEGRCIPTKKNFPNLNVIDTPFGGYPWQAMVLLDSSKSILCSGAILGDDVIATSAQCIAGRQNYDVVIKVGEWKLGSDEEPISFTLHHVKNIDTHPDFTSSTLQGNFALVYLDSKIRFVENAIEPICITDKEPLPQDECVTTGWGKAALGVHAQGAIMHHTKVNPISIEECEKQADGYHYGIGNSICGSTSFDACEVDVGSALACKDKSGAILMKGTYSKESSCGSSSTQTVRFEKPDMKWIEGSMRKYRK